MQSAVHMIRELIKIKVALSQGRRTEMTRPTSRPPFPPLTAGSHRLAIPITPYLSSNSSPWSLLVKYIQYIYAHCMQCGC